MNPAVRLTQWKRDGLRLVWLDPARYSETERQYIVARLTRTFKTPDEIVAERSVLEMQHWLKETIFDTWHDSVLEFCGLEFSVWMSGISLGTIRDIDRHRRFSFEEYTTRALGASLKEHEPSLKMIVKDSEDALTHHRLWPNPNGFLSDPEREFLIGVFYVHPSAVSDQSQMVVDEYLVGCARQLLFYMDKTQDSSKRFSADIWRGALPLALRTPMAMGGNQRDWIEALGKRTCYNCGHHEYVTAARGLVELFDGRMPFLADGVGRWCPERKSAEQCCRAKWLEPLKLVTLDGMPKSFAGRRISGPGRGSEEVTYVAYLGRI